MALMFINAYSCAEIIEGGIRKEIQQTPNREIKLPEVKPRYSTGAILGNILGAHLGLEKIPKNWLKNVELSDELDQLAEDLFNAPDKIKDADKRYPV